jgi:uncharacterized repeat protein (TIGR01451 family)
MKLSGIRVAILCLGALKAQAVATNVNLGTAAPFAVLAGSTVTNTGATIIRGNVGVSPGSAIVGFPPAIVTLGTIEGATAVAAQAKTDLTTAYNAAALQACDFTNMSPTGELGGLTLTPGVHCFSFASAQLTGTLTLDAQGDPNAIFLFKVGSTLTTASSSSIIFTNGGRGTGVFWQVGSSATLGTTTAFAGSILASASITLNTGATITCGRALAQTAAVTLDTNNVFIDTGCGNGIVAAPAVTVGFSPSPIAVNGTAVKTIAISHTNATATTGVGFVDLLTGGLEVAAIPNASFSGNCGTPAPTLTAVPGSNTITFSGATLAAGNSSPCTVTVSVKATTAGLKTNTVQLNSGVGTSTAAQGQLSVVQPDLTVTKAFSPSTVGLGANTVMTIRLSQTSAVSATGVSFTDMLVGGLQVAAAPNASFTGNCGTPTLTATPGNTSVTLTGATLVGGNSNPCIVTVTLTGTATGVAIPNNVQANSDQGMSNMASASVTVLAVAPPFLSKAFGAPGISMSSVTTLTFTIDNPNASNLTGVAFTDMLPAGLIIETPSGLTSMGCDGALIATAGSALISLTGGTVAPLIDCIITVNVRAIGLGPQVNITGNVTANGAPTGNTATATVVVGTPADAYQVHYAANLNFGDSFINFTNTGASSGDAGLGGAQNGNICVNVYTYSPDEQLVSCCSCAVTPNGLNSLSVVNDLTSNTLTPIRPSSVVTKLLASSGTGGVCNAATVSRDGINPLASGLEAWRSTLHALPATAGTPAGTFGVTETPFRSVSLTDAELTRMTQLCAFIRANGSGYGICKSCQAGGLGASKK